MDDNSVLVGGGVRRVPDAVGGLTQLHPLMQTVCLMNILWSESDDAAFGVHASNGFDFHAHLMVNESLTPCGASNQCVPSTNR